MKVRVVEDRVQAQNGWSANPIKIYIKTEREPLEWLRMHGNSTYKKLATKKNQIRTVGAFSAEVIMFVIVLVKSCAWVELELPKH